MKLIAGVSPQYLHSAARPSKQPLPREALPMPMKAGRPARFDYEYQRNGMSQSLHDN
jgi:hypothetical protein